MSKLIQDAMQEQLAQLQKIPSDLKSLPQWVCWAEDKIPINPLTGRYADVTSSSSWNTFDVSLNSLQFNRELKGIGFVFTDTDPYCFIDLDDASKFTNGQPNPNYQIDLDRQQKIFKELDSYSEISPSGRGLHIIVKGKIPTSKRRSFIELYSTERYATFTGNIYHNKPIESRQDALIQLWEQMGGEINNYAVNDDPVQRCSDDEILAFAKSAVNGEKFWYLYNGQWQSQYQSQSEADFAIIDIIAFYTQHRPQIIRIFRASFLGKRDKAKRVDYVNKMINQSFDRMPPKIDFDGFKNVLEERLHQKKVEENLKIIQEIKIASTDNYANISTAPPIQQSITVVESLKSTIKMPPGLLGEIAQFIYQASPRPVPEIALAAAIGLMAGITGRAYNVSGTGLNQYVLLLAFTGAGKEAMAYGIDKLMSIVRQQVPTAPYFIGPSEIASGQALGKYLAKSSQCFVSILGEFGLRLLQMANQNANSAEVTLRRMLLDLYNKSGFGQLLRPSIYADKDKNTDAIPSPAFSILGESTPERFFNFLNEDMISEGLLPRFLLIEYNGVRVPFNKGHDKAQPSFSLIDKLTTLAANSETIQNAQPRRVVDVKFNTNAAQISESYDRFCDKQINNSQKDVIKQLWNRAHIKVLKLSATIAVGVNMFDPVIEEEHINLAIEMVNNDIETLSARFEEGKIGANTAETKQVEEFIKVINDYVTKDWSHVEKYSDKNGAKLYAEKILSYTYISRRLYNNVVFRNDKQGATLAIKRTLQIMFDRDYLREINKSEMTLKFGTTQRAFVISNMNIIK